MPKYQVNLYVDVFGATYTMEVEADSKAQAAITARDTFQIEISEFVGQTIEDNGYEVDEDITEVE